MKHTVIGMDIAKRVFQLHAVNRETGEIERIKLARGEVLPFFAQRRPSLVAIEACGSTHWWGRQLTALGHKVHLIAPKSVRPFVVGNKTDAADARAIWTAVQQPGAHFVAIKTEQQQAILSLHRMRAQLMKFRIMQTTRCADCSMNLALYCLKGFALWRRHGPLLWPPLPTNCPQC